MISFKEFLAENKRFLHGTIIDHVPNIKKNWLQPGTSQYTKNFYGNDIEPTLFLAHHKNVKKAVSSIRGQIAVKLGKAIHKVNHNDIEKHGALIVTRSENNYDIKKVDHEGGMSDLEGNKVSYDHPSHAEPDDYITDQDHKPTGILKGKKLVTYLKKNNHI